MNIAIIRLGRIGVCFLKRMMHMNKQGITIAAVAEISETIGKQEAISKNIPFRKTIFSKEYENTGPLHRLLPKKPE